MLKSSRTWQKYALIFWVCLFLATRLYTLYYGLGYAWTSEEYFRGTIAKEFHSALQGHSLRLPLWQYQADTYLGGTLLVGAITALNYFVFGVNLLSLKLTAIYFSLGAFLLMYFWFRGEVNEAAANTFAFFFVMASPGFLTLSLVSMGYHTESVLFFAATFVLGYRISKNPRWHLNYICFGFVSGIAFWFSYINGITTGAVILCLMLSANFRRETGFRLVSLFLLGLLVGLIPWIYFNWASNSAGATALTYDFMLPENVAYNQTRGFLYLTFRALLAQVISN